MIQLISPNPYIPCKPGWCLAYVNQAFRVPIRYPSATAAWNGSNTKHRDYNFPAGVWVPIWFSLANEPNGHVALRAPDGRVFSTTHPTALTPTEHPNLSHLLNAYARYNPLTYLGWTEDVEGTAVVATGGIQFQSETITPLEEDVANTPFELQEAVQTVLRDNPIVMGGRSVAAGVNQALLGIDVVNSNIAQLQTFIAQKLAPEAGVQKEGETYYLKGEDKPEVYALDVATGNLRHVQSAEFDVVTAIGIYKTVPQAKVDALLEAAK